MTVTPAQQQQHNTSIDFDKLDTNNSYNSLKFTDKLFGPASNNLPSKNRSDVAPHTPPERDISSRPHKQNANKPHISLNHDGHSESSTDISLMNRRNNKVRPLAANPASHSHSGLGSLIDDEEDEVDIIQRAARQPGQSDEFLTSLREEVERLAQSRSQNTNS